MKELKQNTLAEATTESSFLTTINENAGETVVSLQREVELETGETVTVEGITPDKMKAILNNGASPEVVTFKTPGEPVGELDGVCQAYNKSVKEAKSIEVLNLDDEETVENTEDPEETEGQGETEENTEDPDANL